METAVTGKHHHGLIRAAHSRAKGSTHRIAHGAQSAGGQQGAGSGVLIELCRPQLVLTHIGDHNGVVRGLFINFFN